MSVTETVGPDRAPPRSPKMPDGMKGLLRIGFAIGVVILLGALVLAVREWRFIATSTHATATVSRVDREWMSGSSNYRSGNSGGNWGYRVVASFPVDGRTVEARSHSLTSFTGYKVGDTIAVEYPPGQPERAQLVRFVDRWMLELVLAGIGGVFVAICSFAMWLTTVPGARVTTSDGGFGIRSPVYSVETDLSRPGSDNGPKQDTRRTRGKLLIAIILVVGVGIGLLIARWAGRSNGATAPSRPIVASADVPSPPNDDASGSPPRAGYPSHLTVKAPPMPDDDKRAVPPTWTDPASGGATAENLTMAARAFLARPQMDATMQAVLRGQVARLGLNCPGVAFRVGDTMLFAAPAPMFDAGGALQRGLIRQRFDAVGCPARSPVFNIWVFAAGNGVPIRTFAGYPGTTRADLSLMNDATPVVLAMASRLVPDCRTLAIADTHLTGAGPNDATSPWTEDWLVTGCGKTIALTVRFIPDSTRGMTRIEVPDTLARLLATQ